MAIAELVTRPSAGLDEDRRVVWLRGEHDISTVAGVSELLARAVIEGDGGVVVDVTGVEFMGAATVGVIVRARAALLQHSRVLVVRAPSSGPARRILELCGLGALVEPAVADSEPGRGGR